MTDGEIATFCYGVALATFPAAMLEATPAQVALVSIAVMLVGHYFDRKTRTHDRSSSAESTPDGDSRGVDTAGGEQ